VGGALLARRNVRLDRSDKRGAQRLATVYLALGAAGALMTLSGNPENWFDTFTQNLAIQVYYAAMIWMFYLAIEPYVRRQWPEALRAWSRVLDGRLRDPMVGRHILIGALAGMGFTLLGSLRFMGPLLGLAAPAPRPGNLDAVASFPLRVAQVFGMVQESFFIPVTCLLLVLLFRVIFRRIWLAYGLLSLIPALLVTAASLGEPASAIALAAASMIGFATLILVVLTRFGLFALLIAILFSYWSSIVLTTNPASWIFPSSVMTMLLFAAVAVYGFWTSLGEQKLFTDAI
jgi:hypothetical protein